MAPPRTDLVSSELTDACKEVTAEFSGSERGFDPTYMNALFAYGYESARNGYSWKKTPPYIDISN